MMHGHEPAWSLFRTVRVLRATPPVFSVLFMSLIHTCELNEANPFDYLTELQQHSEELKQKPSECCVRSAAKPERIGVLTTVITGIPRLKEEGRTKERSCPKKPTPNGPHSGEGKSQRAKSFGMKTAVLEGLKTIEKMVARDGLEPPTPAFSGLRSTN